MKKKEATLLKEDAQIIRAKDLEKFKKLVNDPTPKTGRRVTLNISADQIKESEDQGFDLYYLDKKLLYVT
ncbi:MAG: hypothetical protein K1060chlam5_01223 [Candidatus Anoxychlamydiales bacterium]|nr:hypothetical protein [Candidatus Anoxychlamydiales bacterium]